MNKYQNIVAIVAAINAAVMLLFPPFVDNPLARGVIPSFESFYPVFAGQAGGRIYRELLTLEIMFVAINALAAWLALNRRTGDARPVNHGRAIAIFAAVNLAVIFAFPPFEPYATLLNKQAAPSFDGFYFLLGDKRHRHFYVPLLYLEVIVVLVNSLTLWLLFNVVRRGELAARDKIVELAGTLSRQEVMELSESLRRQVLDQQQRPGPYGAGADRRKFADPNYRGPERRKGGDRRRRPRTA